MHDNIEYNYDYKYDLIDIHKKGKFNHGKTIELDNGVYLDFDENNVPFALEFISASKILDTEKRNLTSPGINVAILVTDDMIHVEAIFEYKIHEKPADVSIKKDIINDYNIPKMETALSTT